MTEATRGVCVTGAKAKGTATRKTVHLSRALTASLLLTTALVPAAMAGDALPSGGRFAAGKGMISANGSRMDIRQTTGSGIINWNGFSVGAGNQVHFDNGNGATLNRVTGNVSSRIDGNLTATGSVFLVNPAGVAVGTGGMVATGGSFAASTQDATDADFLDGGGTTFSGTSTAEVTNAGTIRSAQGDIALIARRVENTGILEAPNGTAALAAGYEVLMKDGADADGLLSVQLGGSDTEAVNSGTIAAANAEIRANGGNVYALAGNTDGVIKATGATSSGGRIFLTAGATGKVNASGRLKARKAAATVPIPTPRPAREGGTITLTGGDIEVTSTLDVSAESDGDKGGEIMIFAEDDATVNGTLSARGGIGGTGGFVETSGKRTVDFTGVRVDTSAEGGETGDWLIDPDDIIVDVAGAATIASNLASSNVTLQTTSTTASGPVAGTSGGNGDITVNSAITWTSANTLTLNAYNDIAINAAIDGQNGGLTLIANGNSSTDAVGTISTGAGGAVDVGNFVLTRGVWEQVGAGLPDFSANGLDVSGGTFIRALGGDGTFSNPYALFDVYGLQGITTNDWRGRRSGDVSLYYELANDIDASATSSWNGGAGFDPVQLSGSLDGNGYAIAGLYINRPSESNVALIGQWYDNYFTSGRDLEIKDLAITNASVTGDSQTAILVGDTGGGNYHAHNMSNVSVTGSVEANQWGAGVVARYHGNIDRSTMTNVHADVSVKASELGSAVGGLVGIMAEGLTISNSSSKGTINGGHVGGLVGTVDDENNRIENSYSTATVIANGSSRVAGGLVGDSEDLAISNSYFSGQVLGTNGASAGGLVGEAYRNTTIENAFVTGLVEAEGNEGALVGLASHNSVSITDSAWDTDTTGRNEAIGYLGFSTPTVTNTNGLTTAEMQGDLALGGFTLDGSVWGTGSGLYPYFNWEYATTPEAISGTVYTDTGSTVWAGAAVSAISGGNLLGIASTGANGYYYILTPSGSVNPAGALAFLDEESAQGATYSDRLSANGISGADIWGNTFRIETDAANVSSVSTALDTTIGPFSDSDLDFINNMPGTVLRSDGNGKSLDIDLDASSDFSLDQNIYAGGGLTASTDGTFSVGKNLMTLWAINGDLTVNGDMAWNNSNILNLHNHASNTSIAINGSVAATNGTLDINRTGSAQNVASTTIGAIDVGRFTTDTYWTQLGSNLPAFQAGDFEIASGGQFLRALGGDGSEADPYRLFDLYGLQGITVRYAWSADYGVNYQLADDIDASDTRNWNSGAGFNPVALGGSLDGNGHTIDGLFINRPGNWAGLIYYWSDRAVSDAPDVEIKDLSITNADVTGSLAGIVFAQQSWGAQAAHNLTNIYVSGSVAGGTVGGVAGSTAGNYDGVGGQSTVSNVHADVTVSGEVFGQAGGLFGVANEHLIIQDSSATGTVDGASQTGGLIGSTYDDVVIKDSYSTVAVTGNDLAGGLVGYASGGLEISNAFNAGNVRGTTAGGLVAIADSSVRIADAYSSGTVTATGGSGYAGGIVGYAERFVDIQTTYATGAVTGATAGGLVGAMQAATTSITNSVWDVETTGQSSAVGNAGSGVVTNVDGATSAEMKQLSTFTGHGFDADGEGGTGATWRIYEGHTAPLLRSFMTGLSVTGGSGNKVYDGSATSTDVGTLVYGSSFDSSLVFGSAGYLAADADAGTYSGSNLTLDGLYSSQFGYDLTLNAGSLVIAPKTISISASADNKVYDGTLAATGSFGAFSGLISGDVVSLSGGASFAFSDKNAGTGKIVTVSGLGLTGADAGNYTLASTTSTTADVTPKALTVTASADDKVYDGTTVGTGSIGALTGLIGGDAVSVSGASFAFSDKNVGAAKTVTVSGLGLTGADAGNYTLASTTSTTADVTPKALTVTASADDKVYDGTTVGTGSVGALTGLIGGDAVSVSGASFAFSDKNVGAAKTVTVSGLGLTGADAGNYTLASTATTTADITPKALTVSASANDKVYDGTTVGTGSIGALSGLIGGDTVSVTGASFAFSDKNVGAGKTVTVSGLGLTGADAGNYTLASTTSTTADVTPKALTVTASADDKVYDGTTVGTGSVGALTGLIGGDAVSVSGASFAFSDKNVGSSKTVTVSGLGLTGADAGNYTLASTASTTADVTPKTLTVTASADDKIYDGTTATTGSFIDFSGLISGDIISLSGGESFAFSDKDVGAGKTVTVSGIGLTGADAGNYTIASTASTTADITPKTISVSASADDKIYDGTLAATGSFSGFSGLISGDVVSLTGSESFAFSDKNAGTGKTVTVSGVGLTGADAGNYTIASATTATADITPKTLTVSASADDKIYDGTLAATGSFGAFSGLISGDIISLSGSESFAFSDKNAGTGKTVTVSGIGLTGADADNYTLASTATTTADITPKALTVSAAANDKVYDGTTVGTGSVGALTGLIGGDAVSVSGASFAFSDKNVGAAKTVTVSGLGLTGADAGNYTLASTATTTADITPKALTVSASANDKVYDGTTVGTGSIGALSGLIGGDTVSVTGASFAFSDKNVGAGKTVTVSGLGLTGADAGNYTLASTATTTADITPAALWVAADSARMTYGDGMPTLGYSYGGLVGGDDAAVFTGALASGVTSASNVGSYGITRGSLSAGGNYQIVFTGADLVVTRRAITVRADDLVRDINVANPTLTYAILSGSLVNGDRLSGHLSTAASLGSPAGAYAIDQGSLALSPNYDLTYVGGILTILDLPDVPTPDIRPQAYESLPPLSIDTDDGTTDVCEPEIVRGDGAVAVHPCNRSYGAWLSAAAE